MDVAYDHIQEEVLSPDDTAQGKDKGPATQSTDLNTEVREAYKAISASPWGARLGGFLGTVKKQGESYYEGARQELSAASTEASKGLTGLVNQTKSLSLRPSSAGQASDGTAARGQTSSATVIPSLPVDIAKEAQALLSHLGLKRTTSADPPPESSTGDIVSETESLITRFQSEATARLKQIQKAEDAADEALERFGLNFKNFLREAVTIAPPSTNEDGSIKRSVLFESKDADGRRVVHATRFEAQLHVIHSTTSNFTQDPASDEYKGWKEGFNVESKTDEIATDLDKYDELRRAMEKLVPEQVDYVNFWTRYYFLRHIIETEEQRRRELLKGTQADEEDVAWDDDDDDEETKEATPAPVVAISQPKPELEPIEDRSATPTNPTAVEETEKVDMLKPAESRRSNEHSVADSDASYDLLSGPTSRGPGTPTLEKEVGIQKPKTVTEESDGEDWE